MPGGFPISFGQSNFNDQGTVTSGASKGTVITANASANVKGNYSQLVASTPYDIFGFYLNIGAESTANDSFLVDIAVGAAASEVPILNNVVYEPTASSTPAGSQTIFVPCMVPAGSRIAARCQSNISTSRTISVYVIGCDGSFGSQMALGAPQTYGALTASSDGTAIDPGSSSNTKGSWVQITASSTYDIGALQVIFDQQIAATLLAQSWLVDIGVGAGGSEIVAIPNIALSASSSALFPSAPPLFNVNIPAGSRIAARAQGTNTTLATRVLGLSLLGYQL